MNVRRNALTSVVQVGLSSLVLLFLFKTLSKEIGIDGIGQWAVVMAILSLSRVGELGLQTSLVRTLARASADGVGRQTQSAIVSAALIVAAGAVLTILVILSPIATRLLSAQGAGASPLVPAMPLVAFAAWLSSLANISNGALDGLSRVDLRNASVVCGQLTLLAAAMALTPHYGISGLAFAYLAQCVISFSFSLFACLRLIGCSWNRQVAKASVPGMLKFGLKIVPSNVLSVTFEPITRFLCLWAGGFETAGRFELASRIVNQVRSLMVFGFQATMSHFASAVEEELHARTSVAQSVIQLVVPYTFALLIGSFGALSVYWLHSVDYEFLLIAVALAFAWGMNSTVTAAYYALLGMGKPTWTMYSHLLMSALNVALGGLFGFYFGPDGVVLGTCAAIAIGAYPVARGISKELTLAEFMPASWWRSTFLHWIAAVAVLIASVVAFRRNEPIIALSVVLAWAAANGIVFVIDGAKWMNANRPAGAK